MSLWTNVTGLSPVTREIKELWTNVAGLSPVTRQITEVWANDGTSSRQVYSAWKAPNVVWTSSGDRTMTDDPWFNFSIDDYIISDIYDIKTILVPFKNNGSSGTLTAKVTIPNNTKFYVSIISQGGNIASSRYTITRDSISIASGTTSSSKKYLYTDAGEYYIEVNHSVTSMSTSGNSGLTIILSYQKI